MTADPEVPVPERFRVNFRSLAWLLVVLALGLACSSNSDDQGPRVPAGIVLVPDQPRIAQGLMLKLDTRVEDAQGRAISGQTIAFSSSDETVVTVDADGTMHSVGALGTARVTAECDGLTASVDVEVVQRIVSLVVQPDTLEINPGLYGRFQISLLDYTGAVAEPDLPLVFESQDPTVASVDETGLVTAGSSPGYTRIRVRLDSLEVSAPVRVGIIPVRLIVDSTPILLPQQGTHQLTVVVVDQAGNNIPSPSLTFDSSNPTAFTVSPSGLVTAGGADGGGVVRVKIEKLEQDVSIGVGAPPPGMTLVHSTPVAGTAYEADVSPNGAMVVSLDNARGLLRGTLPSFDLNSSFPTSDRPLGVAVNHAGTRAYVVSSEELSVIDLSGNAKVASVPLGGGDKFSIVVSPDDKTAYVSSDLWVYAVDLLSNTAVDSFPVSGSATFLAIHPTANKLYFSEGSVRELDLTTGRVRVFPGGNWVKEIALSPDGQELYAASQGNGNLEVFNTATGKLVQSIPTSSGAFGLAASPHWIAVAGNQGVTVFDRASRIPIAFLQPGGVPRRPAIDPMERAILVPNQLGWVDFIR